MQRKIIPSVATPGSGAGADALPEDLSGLAVFLDIDGTLLDIADSPDNVVVTPGLHAALKRLFHKLDGALALVTGRSMDVVRDLFPEIGIFVACLHGAEWSDPSGRLMHVATTREFEEAKDRCREQVAHWTGVVFEDKGAAFAVHYRLAPEREGELRRLMLELAEIAGEGWKLQSGKCVIELRPRGRDKGDALSAFMALPPFRGRRPLAIGDDVTDEAMFAASNRHGGRSVSVGVLGRPTAATARVASPAEVRAWIERVSA